MLMDVFIILYCIVLLLWLLAARKCVCLGDTHTHAYTCELRTDVGQIVIWTDDDVNT